MMQVEMQGGQKGGQNPLQPLIHRFNRKAISVMASMKRSNSRSLEELLGAGQTKRGAADGHGRPKRTG